MSSGDCKVAFDICPDCAEPVEDCQAKAHVKGACWRWNDELNEQVAFDPRLSPGMTDLMVTPESIDAYLAENPPSPEVAWNNEALLAELEALRERVRAVDQRAEDALLEVMDFVAGWCSPA